MTFEEPVTITFEYDQGNMAECGAVEQSLDIYRRNGAIWEPRSAARACALNTLKITTDHFSFYMAALPWGKGVREDAVNGLMALLPTADR